MVSSPGRVPAATSSLRLLCRALSHSRNFSTRCRGICEWIARRETPSHLHSVQICGGARVTKLWLFCFPLLFLPNLGFSHETTYGVLEMSDWVIGPFLLFLVIAPSVSHRQKISQVNLLLFGFLVWACLSTLSIHARYDYLDVVPILIGCFVKLAKLVLYVIAGVLISTKLTSARVRAQWLWALLAAMCMLSVGVLMSINGQSTQLMDSVAGYKSYNSIIVSIAILGSYIAGLWIDNATSRKWRSAATVVVGFAIC